MSKKFFEVAVGVEELNNSLYEYVVSQMQILNVESISAISPELKAKVVGMFHLPAEMVQVYKLKTLDGKVFFIGTTLYTKTVDKTYIEFEQWLEEEGLIEDLDMEYSQYLEENNISPNEVEEVHYTFSTYDPNVMIAEKQKAIDSIKAKMKILPILELEVENLKADLFSE